MRKTKERLASQEELLGRIMRCITLTRSVDTYRVSGKSDVQWSDRPATSMSHECLGFPTRYVGEKTLSTINYWNIFLYRRPILPAASADGLSIAFLTEALNSEYQNCFLHVTIHAQTPHMYSQCYQLRKSKSLLSHYSFCKVSNS
ncbi:unnamed protein product [Lasius platythorax]|uniref:Uncharacterized protein n=1 Tax=Lasius platythorax TaxID=488582 RepID=A0AAV2NGW0_9HYME